MPLTQITIKNFKSIKDCSISLAQINLLIGENGAGKSTLLEAIEYFYQNLITNSSSNSVFDMNNRYSNEVQISLTYDLSEFVKISKANSDIIFEDDESNEKSGYNGYYKKIISIASKNKKKKIQVVLTQIKGREITWNCSYEDRLIYRSLFPIFLVDARKLDVTQWSYIWDILGEVSKVSNIERKTIQKYLKQILTEKSRETPEKVKEITQIFKAADVSVKPYAPKEYATNLAHLFFAGEDIRQKEKNLEYYSTGTNSVKYIELLLKAIDTISRTKMKEPVVLFDEPELSLHPSYIDELSEKLLDVSPKVNILISTHSPRLTKNMIVSDKSVSLYKTRLTDQHTMFYKMKRFTQYSPASKYRIADDHINSYFSRAILFVEGETELELFSNPYLKSVFPVLKRIDVFKAMSEKPILNIMNPRLVNSCTPYLCLIDIDKAVAIDTSTMKISLKKEFFQENNSERYQFRNKNQPGEYLYFQRKRIEAMRKKLHLHYDEPYFSCKDLNYYEFILAVKQYLLAYNVFSCSTTIEGVLINENTSMFALHFLKNHVKEKDFAEFREYFSRLQNVDKTNVLRLIFNGKSDLLKTWKQLCKGLEPSIKLKLEKVMIGDKTSGWVSDYIDSYFIALTKVPIESEKSFQKYLSTDDNKKQLIKKFQYDFPEFYSLIEKIYDMIKEKIDE